RGGPLAVKSMLAGRINRLREGVLVLANVQAHAQIMLPPGHVDAAAQFINLVDPTARSRDSLSQRGATRISHRAEILDTPVRGVIASRNRTGTFQPQFSSNITNEGAFSLLNLIETTVPGLDFKERCWIEGFLISQHRVIGRHILGVSEGRPYLRSHRGGVAPAEAIKDTVVVCE